MRNIPAAQTTPNGLTVRNTQGRYVLDNVRNIARTLGTFRAARYLRARGWSVEAAMWCLTRKF